MTVQIWYNVFFLKKLYNFIIILNIKAMTKLFLVSAVCICSIALLPSCNIHSLGPMDHSARISKTPTLGSFNSVDIDVSLDAIITMKEGATPSVQLDGRENSLKNIQVKVENNRLVIYSDHSWDFSFSGGDSMSAVITLPVLNSLKLSGSPDAVIHGTVAGDRLRIVISGSSSVSIDSLNVSDFSTDISGSGDLIVKGGTVKNADYQVSGSGEIKAFGLQSLETSASISGSGEADVTASQRLSMQVSGSGDIRYKGHPSVSQSVSGSGSITDAN